jgi:hypothetical protein
MPMPSLFNRSIQLDVFANNQKITLAKPGDKPGVDQLFIEFDVNVSRDEEPNRAKISIYNLNETSRSLLSASHQGVDLFGGYAGEVKSIFRGVTTNVAHHHARTFWKTTLYAGDGEKEYSFQKFNKAYSKGTKIFIILQDMATALGLPNEIIYTDLTASLVRGRSFAGLVKDELTKLTKSLGLQWSIQQGTLEITKRGEPVLSQPFAALLSSDTGMIESPVLIERQNKDKDTKKKKPKDDKEERIIGVRVKSLLNPDVYPNRLIKIVPQQTQTETLGKLMEAKTPAVSAEGVWLVDKAHFYGDNMVGPFHVEAEADITTQVI